MNKKTFNLYDAIDRTRKRPGMYIGEETLENMNAYLAGYQQAMIDSEITEITNPNFSNFDRWIQKRLGFRGTAGWCNMIFAAFLGYTPQNIHWENYKTGATSIQHRESLREFYQLLDEFIKEEK